MSVSHLLFRVGGARYALPVESVVQVESFVGATKVPGAPPYVEGLIYVRGKPLVVINLRARFSLPAAALTEDSRVLVVEHESRNVALLVDWVREVARLDETATLDPSALASATAPDEARFVRSFSRLGESLVMHLDIGRVVGSEVSDVE